MSHPEPDTILKPGHSCWQIVQADRLAFLVDGEAYFSAFASAVERARRSVYILGWDIDSRVRLWRDERRSSFPSELGAFLNSVVSRRRGLQVYILDWDFAMLYAFEREPLPIYRFGWQTHHRLHFALDDHHPIGASHHQKVVVVDDRLAFVGGFDLARVRWDTPSHLPGDKRRFDCGSPYPPFHDVQVMVEGGAAAALGELARQRWLRSTGRRLRAEQVEGDSPWPPEVTAELENVRVAIARTDPAWEDRPEICEGKNLFLAAISAARSSIYLEHQYLTAPLIGNALAERLSEKHGPEVILVLPRCCSGWLENNTMGVLRAAVLAHLRQADIFGRLHVYHPEIAGLNDGFINIHSKVMMVDDRFVRVGSSNLTNRSMGLDTECDFALEAGDRPEVSSAISAFRNRLLGEHLGVDPAEVAREVERTGSLHGAIEGLRNPARWLEPLQPEPVQWLADYLPDTPFVDPERPAGLEILIRELALEGRNGSSGKLRGKGLVFAVSVLVILGLSAAWRWTPMNQLLDLQTLHAWGEGLRGHPLAPFLVAGIYVAGGLVLFPVTLLILATALVFDPLGGFLYALSGAVASALSTYGIGRLLARDTVRRLAGGRLNKLSRWLGQRGMMAVMVVRLMPVAPFSIVNMVAGASHIGLRDFFIGTLLGMAPGVLAITVFGKSLERAIEEPQGESFLILAGVTVGAGLLIALVRRWLRGRSPEGGRKDADS